MPQRISARGNQGRDAKKVGYCIDEDEEQLVSEDHQAASCLLPNHERTNKGKQEVLLVETIMRIVQSYGHTKRSFALGVIVGRDSTCPFPHTRWALIRRLLCRGVVCGVSSHESIPICSSCLLLFSLHYSFASFKSGWEAPLGRAPSPLLTLTLVTALINKVLSLSLSIALNRCNACENIMSLPYRGEMLV